LDPVGSVGARVKVFGLKGSPSGWIDGGVGTVTLKGSPSGWMDDGAGTVRNRFELRCEIPGWKRGGDVACGLGAGAATSSVTGALLVGDS
jgi:hypothetical protein